MNPIEKFWSAKQKDASSLCEKVNLFNSEEVDKICDNFNQNLPQECDREKMEVDCVIYLGLNGDPVLFNYVN